MKSVRFSRSILRIAALSTALSFASSSQAAIDVFLKFLDDKGDVIRGDSRDATFRGQDGWFEVRNFNLGMENSVIIGSTAGGAGAGKAKFKSFSISKIVDSVSPVFFKTAAQGQHFKGGKLAIRKAGAAGGTTSNAFLEYHFNLIVVTNVDWSGNSGDDVPEETVTFEFGAMQLRYRSQKNDGTLNQPVIESWNVVENSEEFENVP